MHITITIVMISIITSLITVSVLLYLDRPSHLLSFPLSNVLFALADGKLSSPSLHSSNNTASEATMVDKFGVREIYPTKQLGREWYVNMTNPKNDTLLAFTFDAPINKEKDGSWQITNPKVRMNVETPTGMQPWKNVEITGYAKVISVNVSKNNGDNNKNNSANQDYSQTLNDIAWYARSGRHNSETPCEGTALIGGIHTDGSVGWKKSIWFTGGYTDERALNHVTKPLIGRWIGWKVVIYNIDNDTAVKMESYLDDKNNNQWRKVASFVDNGGWYANTDDITFFGAGCGKPKDYVITNPGDFVTFRTDNIIWNFKNLSVREIKSPTAF
ncbi:MAG: hypothetical protein WBP64_06890 [Nitrososphaeraceae archaeon]